MNGQGSTTFRARTSRWLLALILWISVAATLAVSRARPFIRQPGAAAYLGELASILAIYIPAIAFSRRLQDERWQASHRNGVMFGLLSASVETTSIVLENLSPRLFGHAFLSICMMLVTFLICAVAAIWKPGTYVSWETGLLAAVECAAICMLIAVAIGFPVELFLKPPDPAIVATWSEYQRSGWTNPRLFALANTLESGFTHLLLAPFIAIIFGSGALLLIRIWSPGQPATRKLEAK